MSGETASSIDFVIVHVRLLNEGVEVWRPVQARRVSESTYRLSDTPIPEDEAWSFRPGDVVVAERRSGGARAPEALVAVARASDFDEISRRIPYLVS